MIIKLKGRGDKFLERNGPSAEVSILFPIRDNKFKKRRYSKFELILFFISEAKI